MNDKALTRVESQPLAVSVPAPELNLQAIAERILSGEVTNEKLAMIKDLVAMDAERKFTVAFNALQSELPALVAKTEISNRGKYMKFEDLMHEIQPFLTKHGFTVSFSNDFKDNRIVETCVLKHVSGHSQSSSYAVRVSGRADSETQADVKAGTTAKRKAIQDALNLVIRQDCLNEEQDPRMEGRSVSREQAEELAHRVEMLGDRVNRESFFKFAGATTFSEIAASRYEDLDRLLSKKEK